MLTISSIKGVPVTAELHTALPELGRVRMSEAEHAARQPAMRALAEQVKDKTGIVFEHLVPFQRYATESNCVIGVRAVDPLATGLISDGHPTKNFLIKGKSASWGPQAGLICADQRFSKLEGRDPKDIEKYNKQVRQCLDAGHARVGPLIVGRERLEEIQKHFVQNAAKTGDEPALRLSEVSVQGDFEISARAPSGECYIFQGKQVGKEGELAYRIEYEGLPLEVLKGAPLDVSLLPNSPERCHQQPPPNELPLTADYDLLMISPSFAQLDERDNMRLPDVSHGKFMQRLNHYSPSAQERLLREAAIDLRNPARFYAAADKLVGNASQRIKQMIPEINEALVGREGQWLVHHSADSGNPATDPAANYPATFFLPERIGRFEEICVIENNRELAELVQQAKDAGYHMPINPLWDDEPGLAKADLRRSSFEDQQARMLLQQRLRNA